MPASPRAVAVANGKGGVGKTSFCSHVGALAANAGNRVLLVELDSQGNLGEDLGYSGAGLGDDGEGLFDAVRKGTMPFFLKDVRPGLDVVPGGEAVAMIRPTMDTLRRSGKPEGEPGAVGRALAPLATNYDLVLIDTPPIDKDLQEEALLAAAWVLIMTKTDGSSRKGLRKIAQLFVSARRLHPALGLLGVVQFGVTPNATRIRAKSREYIELELGGTAPVLQQTIRHVEAAAFDVRDRGQLAHELEKVFDAGPSWTDRLRASQNGAPLDAPQLAASSATLASDYQNLTTEFLTLLLQAETRQGVAV
ncbi:MAG: ParA family protein [Longispora sp.]|nr:ParA family protein [Longispora sp. (in: high G+C Gram-positive bacteria)]